MRVKTSELSGAALDWAVAKCEGYVDDVESWLHESRRPYKDTGSWHPSANWAQGGPIIEREKMKTFPNVGGSWSAQKKTHVDDGTLSGYFEYANGSGITPLIAAMRTYVASKLGEHVDVPDELV